MTAAQWRSDDDAASDRVNDPNRRRRQLARKIQNVRGDRSADSRSMWNRLSSRVAA